MMPNAVAHHPLSDAQPILKQQAATLTASSPNFDCSAWCHVVWDIPFVSWGQLSQLHPLPAFCTLPAYLLVWWGEDEKRL